MNHNGDPPLPRTHLLSRHVFAFILHLYAALTEKERSLIAERTKAALALARGAMILAGDRSRMAETNCRSIHESYPANRGAHPNLTETPLLRSSGELVS